MRSRFILAPARLSAALLVLFLLFLLAAFARTATANPVGIQDASFDNRSLASGAYNATLTPWQETGGNGNSAGFIERISGFAADGQNHLGMALNHNVWQDLGVTYQPNTRYTLTVAVGNRGTAYTLAANQSRYLLAASDGTVFATGSRNASTIPAGTFADAPALLFETGSSSAAIGKTVLIRLEARGSGRSHFDRVRLTAVATMPPLASTLAATEVTDNKAILNGTVNARGPTTTVVFEYGPTSSYGSTQSAVPPTISGNTTTAVAAKLDGLAPGTTYHCRVVATSEAGTTQGSGLTFTTEIPAYLSALAVSQGALRPTFAETVTSYAVQVPASTTAIRLTPETRDATATIRVLGVEVASGTASVPIPLAAGNTVINVAVSAAGSSFAKPYRVTVTRPPESFVFTSPDTPPIEAAAFDATGLSIGLSLGFAPETGTSLVVVKHTGQDFIVGSFANFTQGQRVDLTHNGIFYPFEVNYYGGDGNDLVLEWANTRLLAWGANDAGQLGIDTNQDSLSAAMVLDTGVLAGKRIVSVASGYKHSLALCSDGRLAAWGNNSSGQLGDKSWTSKAKPILVDTAGALAGKRVIAIAAGGDHSLALCSDGTVVSWGEGSDGQLGVGDLRMITAPAAVDRSGLLASRTVISIAAGASHSLALCSDGTLAAWGTNYDGRLGDGTTSSRASPVAVAQSGVLAGKKLVGLAGGVSHTLALCSDGTLAAWGGNGFGQLGINSTTDSTPPVLVNTSGVLAGKTVTAVAAGGNSSYALCSDGTLASWGSNLAGQLGNGGTTQSNVPVAVTKTAALTGRTITAIGGRSAHAFALCSDGKAALWGTNTYGQLGNGGTTSSNVPVLAGPGVLRPGERLSMLSAGGTGNHALAIAAAVPPSLAVTLAASGVSDQSATLLAEVNPNGSATDVVFEYGLTSAYGKTLTASPAQLSGTVETQVGASITGLMPGATYHFRVVTSSAGGTRFGEDQTFTTTTSAALAGLAASVGALEPDFRASLANYSLTVASAVDSIRFTPVIATPGASVTVAGVACESGAASSPVPLFAGSNPLAVVVTSADGNTRFTYTVTVARIPQTFSLGSAGITGLRAESFTIGGITAGFSLGSAPLPGTVFTVLDNSGGGLIRGEFANLAQGEMVIVEFGGIAYPFVANYYGSTGNDLTLEWANTRPVSWGGNQTGQLGADLLSNSSPVPVAVDRSGILAGRTIMATSAGDGFNVAFCADGTLAAWGINYFYGQLGNNRTTSSRIPVRVDVSGVLAGKKVVAVASGTEHTVVLCADGTVASWGRNDYGQLGGGSTVDFSMVPVAVDRSGVLAGKTVVAISAGSDHNLALCSDGTLAAWGSNGQAQLGDGTLVNRPIPVLVNIPDFLRGKIVVRIAAGGGFNLVLYSDGTMATWGANNYGQLGIGSVSTYRGVVQTGTSGILAGKSVTDIATGDGHALALCSDGTLAAWGNNNSGQLGNNSTTNSLVPVAVVRSGVLAGRTVTNLAAGVIHSLVRCSDGTMAGWGWNYYGSLGNGVDGNSNPNPNSSIPVQVNASILKPGERFGRVISAGSNHSLALVASPPPPVAETLAAAGVGDNRATLNAGVYPNGLASTVSFEYGLTTGYGATIAATPASFNGTGSAAASGVAEGLLTNTSYHYRVVVTNANGTWHGNDMTFTTSGLSTLAGLTVSAGEMVPGFAPVTTGYAVSVPHSTDRIILTPVAAFPGASITVNGTTVASGAAGGPIVLAEGDNRIDIVVTAADGINSQTYTVSVTRVPQRLRFDSPGSVPVNVAGLQASGSTIEFELAFQPQAGTKLTAVNQSGLAPIVGVFDNLAHGQQVVLPFGGIGYPFVADYFGGDGNDLVLRWAHNRLFGWGNNVQRQMGFIDSSSGVLIPTPANDSELLSNKSITAVATGGSHTLVLRSDGIVAAIGSNSSGQLGNPGVTDPFGGSPRTAVPVEVDRKGVLAGKAVVAVAAGSSHSLALCADGTLAAWGAGTNGKLGNNSTTQSNVPVEVDRSGVLADRRVVAVAAGPNHNLALCQDGSVVAWGFNNKGQLGNGSQTDAPVPVAVDVSGVLAGKKVVGIAAGSAHCLVLCDDGTLATWGENLQGQLGNDDTRNSTVPVAVKRGGVLAGKSVTKVIAGNNHNMVLCDDGTLAAWGYGGVGQLGDGITTYNYQSLVPVAVLPAAALVGKKIIAAAAGNNFSLALCSDRSAAAWGAGTYGALGNGSSSSSTTTPVAISQTNLAPGERLMEVVTGSSAFYFSLAVIGSPPLPAVATRQATDLLDRSATLNASVYPNNASATVSFEYGLTTAYGKTVAARPAQLSGTGEKSTSCALTGLLAGTTYHYRVVATSAKGTSVGKDMTFTTAALATLADLSLGGAAIAPSFNFNRTQFVATVPFTTTGITVIPVAAQAMGRIRVNGTEVQSGVPGATIPLAPGGNVITIEIASAGGGDSTAYQITVTRLPEEFAWASSAAVPVTAQDFSAAGNAPRLVLGHLPQPGGALMMVNNTGPDGIHGVFDNLAPGQKVTLEFDGVSYDYFVNYHGGDGNDLALEWGNARLVGWGTNAWGELGVGDTTAKRTPVPVDASGVLSGKGIRMLAAGQGFTVVLCMDGTMAAWGRNDTGQLGNGTTVSSLFPVEVVTRGILAGKNVISIRATATTCYALCSDHTLVRWGANEVTGANDLEPVLMAFAGALAGKQPVAIATGSAHVLALCTDGSVVAWGDNRYGKLGDGTTTNRSIPVAVTTGALAGRKVVAISAGIEHSLALCGDGTLAAWGYGWEGRLGNGSTSNSSVPVEVNRTGVLAGRKIVEISAGGNHSLVRCADGTLAAWGAGSSGQLGNGTSNQVTSPVLVNRTGVLSGKTVTAVWAGSGISLARCQDGTLAAWGYNQNGELGDGGSQTRTLPGLVDGGSSGAVFTPILAVATSSGSSLAVVAKPLAPAAATLAADALTDTSARLNASVRASGTPTRVWFEFGGSDAFGRKFEANPSPVSGGAVTASSAGITGLRPGRVYFYRVIAENGGGRVIGETMSFSTTTVATLAGLTTDGGTLLPVFQPDVLDYIVTVPASVSDIRFTPVVAHPGASITVNGGAVTDGEASDPVRLASGNNVVEVVVTSSGGTFGNTYNVTVTRLPDEFVFNSAQDLPVSAAGFTAPAGPVPIRLGFAPAPGTSLTIVDNTSLGFIRGSIGNLAHGQRVDLEFNGILYPFIANYYGGTGNDLVLEWANALPVAWGRNDKGQLGLGDITNRFLPLPAPDRSGVLAGKTVMSIACGTEHSLALCSDGTLTAWGAGRLGNVDLPEDKLFPVAVDMSGDLYGKTVIAVAAGGSHSLVLCSDGSLAAWGQNGSGQLGATGTANSNLPTRIESLGALAGRKVVSIHAGYNHNLALCEDGVLAAWGYNEQGALGDGTFVSKMVPVRVGERGLLAEKAVTMAAAGAVHSLALCADGTLISWGRNDYGQLGDGTAAIRALPVEVDTSGVLAGKRIIDIAAGSEFSAVLCADGTLATWGRNSSGQLGNGTTTSSNRPVAVDMAGVMTGRKAVSISISGASVFAMCDDGTTVSWGGNSAGTLGSGSEGVSYSHTPVIVAFGSLGRAVAVTSHASGSHAFALVASPPLPLVETLAATDIGDTTATLRATVRPNGQSATIGFEFGLSQDYGGFFAAEPGSADGIALIPVQAAAGNLLPNTTYHFRGVATCAGGVSRGGDQSFTTGDRSTLAGLALSAGDLSPAFNASVLEYAAVVSAATDALSITAFPTRTGASIKVNGAAIAAGVPSSPIPLATGNTQIRVEIGQSGGVPDLTYTVTVTRLPETILYPSGTAQPITVGRFTARGPAPEFGLGFAPTPGTDLMVVNNTGFDPIEGAFENLAQGREVSLTHGGIVYQFVADYFGGTGNDLILRWANTRLLAWGQNSNGQLGDGSTTSRSIPMDVISSGVLAGKSVTQVAISGNHGLALCADGTVAAWGAASLLGDGIGIFSAVPVAVDRSGALAGRTVIRVAAGENHSLALCSDGTVVSWGSGSYGVLGVPDSTSGEVPVEVDRSGVLAGKKVVAIAAGQKASYALCLDGTLAAWGSNEFGQLGIGSIGGSYRFTPVEVKRQGAQAGRRVVALDSMTSHCMALCSDGTLIAWGYNRNGPLGNNSAANSPVPVAVDLSGVLAGKTVSGFAVGEVHSLALCADGMLATWGDNYFKQLGDNVSPSNGSPVPVLVNPLGALAGKTPVTVSAGGSNCFVLCTDGFLAGWGRSDSGSLGTGNSSNSSVPVAVTTTMLRPGERFTAIEGGTRSTLGIVATQPRPLATTVAAGSITDTGAELRGLAMPNGNNITVTFEYGLTTAYGNVVAATPGTLQGTGSSAVSALISSLPAGTTWHYRLVCSSEGAISRGEDMTFTTGTGSLLSGLTLSAGSLSPEFSGNGKDYAVTVPFTTGSIRVTSVAITSGAVIRVNGTTVESGVPSEPIPLPMGESGINISVDSPDGLSRKLYSVKVTRLPDVFVFSAPGQAPLRGSRLDPRGIDASFQIRFAPVPGTELAVLENAGIEPIAGWFSNLEPGKIVELTHEGLVYRFVADYHGGTGNDLVLRWSNVRLFGWGQNDRGQTGGTSGQILMPAPVFSGELPGGRIPLLVKTGSNHSLVLCADGSILAWGDNEVGQLGNGTTVRADAAPVMVDQSGALAGKRVVMIDAGDRFSLALCADGTLVSWGNNNSGILGIGTNLSISTVPVEVDKTGVLAGRKIVSISAGSSHTLALCTDGTVVAWGSNWRGKLGADVGESSRFPVAVNASGVLRGKSVVAVAAGGGHSLALCSDGILAAWGWNDFGQLGDGTTTSSPVPVRVDTSNLPPDSKIATLSSSEAHNMALLSDGRIAVWGTGSNGRLGLGDTNSRLAPVMLPQSGILGGRAAISISAGIDSSLAFFPDGTAASWGSNGSGQLGDGTTSQRLVPGAVDFSQVHPSWRVMSAVTRAMARHSLAMVGVPARPIALTDSATQITDSTATLNARIGGNGNETPVAFDFGITEDYGTVIEATPRLAAATGEVAITGTIGNLLPGTTYHYRVRATSASGEVAGEDRSFTTGTSAALAGLALSGAVIEPAVSPGVPESFATVLRSAGPFTLIPLAATPGAKISVNGKPVISGAASPPLDLPSTENEITITVTSSDGTTTRDYRLHVTVLPDVFRFGRADDVPFATSRLIAPGLSVGFDLGFASAPGTRLTVVDHTGSAPISGTFANLSQGQEVLLTYDGVTYPFIANYFGGDGNDLVLEWGATRILGWGNTVTLASAVPVNASPDGWVFNNGVAQIAAGGGHYVVLHFDGTLSTWGDNSYGQLGDNSYRASIQRPVNVDMSGALAGKRVVSVAAGTAHSLALCSDGTLAAWGRNWSGQLGVGGDSDSRVVPTIVDRSGVLSGRRVVSITAGPDCTYAVCSDGAVAAWGDHYSSQLGNGRPTGRYMLPTLVDASGILAGKKVIKVAAGGEHALVLCEDGTLVSWGTNYQNQLGNNALNSWAQASPVAVDVAGILSGKTVIDIAAGDNHSLALCSDGTIAAWGDNSKGQLGAGWTEATAKIPVEVSRSGALAGKSVIAVQAGMNHCFAFCSDGSIVAWGDNSVGQLGIGASGPQVTSATPVEVSRSGLLPGERVLSIVGNPVRNFSHALTALPGRPQVTTLAAAPVGNTRATLRGEIKNPGATDEVFFDYGQTPDYGGSIAVNPSQLLSAVIDGLIPGTTYHFRVRLRTGLGTFVGEDRSFVTSTDATLLDIALSAGDLFPNFAGTTRDYSITLPFGVASIVLTPRAADPAAAIMIAASPLVSGQPSTAIPLALGANTIPVTVTAVSGETLNYTITVTRLPESIVIESPNVAPLSGALFQATGELPPVSLGFVPATGAILRLVEITGAAPIHGRFSNLAQGQMVTIEHAGSFHRFTANYHGGDGNDLVLQWANTRLVAWGSNTNGRFGNGFSSGESHVPTEAGIGGALTGKRVIQVFGTNNDTMALCSDGTLSAWSGSYFANIGSGYYIPKAVDQTGAFAGKEIAALALRSDIAIALCADGSLVGWGNIDHYGQFPGDLPRQLSVPSLIEPVGALAGRRVSALAMGDRHVLALCADGALVSWGTDMDGRHSPKLVSPLGAIAGKRVVAISAGENYNLALCSDGTVAAWGVNDYGQLGNNSTKSSRVPVAVDMSSVLPGGKVVAVSAGRYHSLALGDDGTLVAWGYNNLGQLGTGNTVNSLVPAAVDQSGVLAGKTIREIRATADFNHVLCDDGTIAGWGSNSSGKLGNGISSGYSAPGATPVATTDSTLREGERFMSLAHGYAAAHQVALVATPAATALTMGASDITGLSATLHGSARVYGQPSKVWYEVGESRAAMLAVPGDPSAVDRRVATPVRAAISGLRPGTTYLYRIVVENEFGTIRGEDRIFTTLSDNAMLAGFGTSAGNPAPVFDKEKPDYLISVANSMDQISITPLTGHPGARVRIGGRDVVSGTASQALPLIVGSNTFSVFVTAEDRIATRTYTLVVTRLPAVLPLDGSGVPPVTADGFSANDLHAMLRLDFHPSPGSTLVVVNNTSLAFIHGRFSNLAQGQRVWLSHNGVRYAFVANYHGGTGNDLVLQWAGTRAAAWGLNNYGQLGDRGNKPRLSPIAVDDTGVLADKTIFAVATGYLHSLVLCSDGTLASWGYNIYGQLGDNGLTHQSVPVAVDTSGVLADKVVIAICSGSHHNLALCSDGTIAAWGFNNHGQLGDGTKSNARTPVLVMMDGVLAGKQVVAVAAGAYQSFALCADGTLAAWGYNDEGELGNGGNTSSLVPVAVDVSGALAGRKVASIAAGLYHTLALCTDGSVVSWGYNQRGQLGNSSTTHSASPIEIGSFGALAGKSVRAVAAGASHSLALCTDGTLAAWGFNSQNQLGMVGIIQSTVPVALAQHGRPLAALAAGAHHNLLHFTDGSMTAWGGNTSGQLGSNNTQASAVAVGVDTGALDHGGFIMFAASGSASSHNLAVFAVPVDEPAGLQAWRLDNFGDVGSGNLLAGDCADCDHDGIPNLVEYAFRLDPHQNSAGKVPQPKRVGNRFELRFSRSELAADIEYGAEWSPDLSPGSWRDVPDSGIGDEHAFSLPVDTAPNMFMRLRVRSVIPN